MYRDPDDPATQAPGSRAAIACWARHPVQWPGTISSGPSSTRASRVAGMIGSNAGPFRWKPVPYTHLDVYKRQAQVSARGAPGGGGQRYRGPRTPTTSARRDVPPVRGQTGEPMSGEATTAAVQAFDYRKDGADIYTCLLYTSRCV